MTARQPKGVPAGGQFAATAHAEPATRLGDAAASISVPCDPSLHRLVYEDRLSNGERRSYARQALDESLERDDFNVVHTEEAEAGIREEADRDDSVDRALSLIGERDIAPARFGAELARELESIRGRRLARESHYVPTRQALFDRIAPHIEDTPEDYEAALKEVFPHAGPIWYEAMLRNQKYQPVRAQRDELAKMAVVGERDLALRAPRPEVSEDENPDFTSHPVNALESKIDALISVRGDPTDEANINYLAHDVGDGYGRLFIRQFAEVRLAAWRHTPIERTGKA